jgi:hypothetical protein
MNDLFHAFLGGVIALSLVCGVASSAQAQTHARLVYENGPVLKQFSISPLYHGDWSSAVDQAVSNAE